ncbi:MAG: 30S ribosome-binding factor RbfA [Actinobacteria bacterium]|nr:MAG: 30S ribosome-binding factor RbfA [Actinomycetota bacterium]TMK65999.1 MAG: 30S ribosome-binding factor RbfA [Actinomycetota bacterium]
MPITRSGSCTRSRSSSSDGPRSRSSTLTSPCTLRMTEGTRPGRVSEEFREILAEEIPKLKDPRIGFVTVIQVRVTPDLRLARVFYTAMGDEKERKATAAGLRSARAHLRQVIGGQVRIKTLPDLQFEEDRSIEEADRIDRLIRQLHEGEP